MADQTALASIVLVRLAGIQLDALIVKWARFCPYYKNLNHLLQYVRAMCRSVRWLKSQRMSRLIQCAQSANSTNLIEVDWVTKWISDTYSETLYHTDHFAISKWQTHHFHAIKEFEDSWPLQCIFLENRDFKFIFVYALWVKLKLLCARTWTNVFDCLEGLDEE